MIKIKAIVIITCVLITILETKAQSTMDSYVKLKYLVMINDTGCYLNIYSGKLESSSNEYITNKGLYLSFRSAVEIDEFISKILPEKINSFINKPKKEDLFK